MRRKPRIVQIRWTRGKPRIIRVRWTRGEPTRKGDRPLDFLKCRVVIFFVFIFLFEADLLTALTAIQFRAEPGTILARRFEERPPFG